MDLVLGLALVLTASSPEAWFVVMSSRSRVVRGFTLLSLWTRDLRVIPERNALMTPESTTSGCHSVDVNVVPSLAPSASVTVRPEPLAHMRSTWSRYRVGLRRDRGALPHSRRLLWWADGAIRLVRPQCPGRARGRVPLSRRGAFCLLNGGCLHQRPEVPVDRLLLGVGRLGEAAQKHLRGSDVPADPTKLRGIVPSSQDVYTGPGGRGLERRSPS